MKTIIDNATGELIEVEEKNEIAERTLVEAGVITQETYEMLASFKYYQDQYELFKHQLMKAMKDNNIKSWKNEYFTATIKDETLRKSVDVERLKEDGLYDNYLKLSPVKESIQIKFKEGI